MRVSGLLHGADALAELILLNAQFDDVGRGVASFRSYRAAYGIGP